MQSPILETYYPNFWSYPYCEKLICYSYAQCWGAAEGPTRTCHGEWLGEDGESKMGI